MRLVVRHEDSSKRRAAVRPQPTTPSTLRENNNEEEREEEEKVVVVEEEEEKEEGRANSSKSRNLVRASPTITPEIARPFPLTTASSLASASTSSTPKNVPVRTSSSVEARTSSSLRNSQKRKSDSEDSNESGSDDSIHSQERPRRRRRRQRGQSSVSSSSSSYQATMAPHTLSRKQQQQQQQQHKRASVRRNRSCGSSVSPPDSGRLDERASSSVTSTSTVSSTASVSGTKKQRRENGRAYVRHGLRFLPLDDLEVQLKRAHGFVIRRMTADGNCLFRAVAEQLYGDAEMHQSVRRLCLDYMEREEAHYADFVDREDWSHYLARKRRDGCFGNNLEIQAMAELFNRPIEIYADGPNPINIFHHSSYGTSPSSRTVTGVSSTNQQPSPTHSSPRLGNSLPPLRLSYHAANHYNAVIDPNNPTIGVGLGFANLEPGLADKTQLRQATRASEEDVIERELVERALQESIQAARVVETGYVDETNVTDVDLQQVLQQSREEFWRDIINQSLGSLAPARQHSSSSSSTTAPSSVSASASSLTSSSSSTSNANDSSPKFTSSSKKHTPPE